MDFAELAALIERPDIHDQILGDYDGPYSLGITRSPDNESEYALLLRVEGEPSATIRREIIINNERIPVIVRGAFIAPRAMVR